MRDRFPYLAVAGVVTALLHYFAHVPWGWAALAIFVGWPILGTLVTIDDDLRGGWSNPDGTVRPPWLTAPYWGHVCVSFAIVAFIAAADANWGSRAPIVLASLGIVASSLAVFLLRNAAV